MLTWASAFSNLLELTAKEKSLVQATVVYKRPPTLASMLTNYKKVAHSTTENTSQGKSQPCKKCALCGHFNHYKSMLHQTSTITAAKGKIFALKQTLNCSNYGIYVATCRLCHKQYVGQTINKFSKRWCHHRFIWNQFKYDNIDNKAALLLRRDGVVVIASASQSVDLGFIPLVESYQKTLKNGIRSFPAWRSAFRGGCGEQAGKFACCVFGQGT